MVNIYSSEIVNIIMSTIEKPSIVKEGFHLEPNLTLYAENGYLRYNAYWELVQNANLDKEEEIM